jgi:transcription antitermination factor NusG
VEKAANKLLVMGEAVRDTFNSATTNLTLTELTVLADHLKHFVRVQSTEKAVSVKLTVGQVVRIVNGPAKFIGCIATVVKPQRIRTYVEVPGVSKPIYLFTSDVVPLRASDASELSTEETVTEQATGTEG